MHNLHCLDSSVFINSWRKYYPPHVFKTYWVSLDKLIRQKTIISCRDVFAEIQRQDDDLLAWAINYRNIFEDANDDTIQQMLVIMKRFPNLAAQGGATNGADPWVVAHAIARRAIVVTDEQPAVGIQKPTKPPKIPDVCAAMGVRCLGIVEFLQQVGLAF